MNLSITEGGKEGKSKAITVSKYLEERFQENSKTEGFVLAAGERRRRREERSVI